MRFHSSSDSDVRALLRDIGVPSVSALFDSIPRNLLLDRDLRLPEAESEIELDRRLQKLARTNRHAGRCPSFLGAGAYHHYIPAVVEHLILRGEFLTAGSSDPDNSATVNKDPYGEGWLVRIRLSDPQEANKLLRPDAYSDYVKEAGD